MPRMRFAAMKVAKVCPFYVRKTGRKGRSAEGVDEIIGWLTGYSGQELHALMAEDADFATVFSGARLHPSAGQSTGVICGVRLEDIADPVEQNVRRLDKLIDELAKGRPTEKILRT